MLRVPSVNLFSPLDDSLEAQSVFSHPSNATTQILLKMFSGDRGIVYHFKPTIPLKKKKKKTLLPSPFLPIPSSRQVSNFFQPPSAASKFFFIPWFSCSWKYLPVCNAIWLCISLHDLYLHSLPPCSTNEKPISGPTFLRK